MSSIVSRNPPPSGSTSQAKDFFWMSIRFGTSIDLSRRANVRRVREASTEAKTATPRGGRVERAEVRGECQRHTGATSQDSTGVGEPPGEGRSTLTDPARPGSRMWREGRCGRLRLSVELPQDSDSVKQCEAAGRESPWTRPLIGPDSGYHFRGMVRRPGTPLISLQSEHPPSFTRAAARHRSRTVPPAQLRHHRHRSALPGGNITRGRLHRRPLDVRLNDEGRPAGALREAVRRGAT